MRRFVPFLLLLSACGGSSPTAPVAVTTTTLPPAVSAMRDGITGATVEGAVATDGAAVTVSALGYMTREQPSTTTVWLWPQSETYGQAIVYTHPGSGVPIALRRWRGDDQLRLAISRDLAQHQDLLRSAAAELVRVSRATVIVLNPGDTTANVTVSIGTTTETPTGTALAATFWQQSGSTIIGARVTFLLEQYITGGPRANTLLHELGHVLGLGHSPDPGDVMSVAPNRRNERTFGPEESKALTMMYSWRKAGNQFPDREVAGARSAARTAEIVACLW